MKRTASAVKKRSAKQYIRGLWNKPESLVRLGLYLLIAAACFGLGASLLDDSSHRLVRSGTYPVAVSNGTFEVVVSKVSVDTRGISHFATPPVGQKYICLHTTVRNIGGSTVSFVPVVEAVVTADGSTNPVYLFSGAPNCPGGLAGPIERGQSMSGGLGFTVPLNTSQVALEYSPHDNNLPSIRISNIGVSN